MIRQTLANTQAATFAVQMADPERDGMPVPIGTGFFVSPDGWFVTAAHVVTQNGEPDGPHSPDVHRWWLVKETRIMPPGSQPRVRTGPLCNAPRLELVLPAFDLALLKVDFESHSDREFLTGRSGFPFLQVSTRQLEEAEPIYAFGYPLSTSAEIDHPEHRSVVTVALHPRTTAGIVSSTYDHSRPNMRSDDVQVYIIDRALNYGNSGGPIVAVTTGNVHALCSSFQVMLVEQKQWPSEDGTPPVVLVPSLYGKVISLHHPAVLAELQRRDIPLTAE